MTIPRSRRRLVFGTVAALALALLLIALLRPAQRSPRGGDLPAGLAPGLPAPDFSLRDTGNRTVRLSSLRGHPVLLNFWATYCVPCRLEMPDLERAARHFGSADPQRSSAPLILGIDAGAEDRATVARFARQVGVGYPLLLDPTFSATLAGYHVANIPTTVVIDARGAIRQAHLGPLAYADILGALDAAR